MASGSRTERDVYMEFMSLFDTQNSSAPISWEEFQAVHHDWSANFSKDEDWENAMHSAWKC